MLPSRMPKIAQIIIQERNHQATRHDKGPEDPKVVRDEDLPPLGIEVEELGAEYRLSLAWSVVVLSLCGEGMEGRSCKYRNGG